MTRTSCFAQQVLETVAATPFPYTLTLKRLPALGGALRVNVDSAQEKIGGAVVASRPLGHRALFRGLRVRVGCFTGAPEVRGPRLSLLPKLRYFWLCFQRPHDFFWHEAIFRHFICFFLVPFFPIYPKPQVERDPVTKRMDFYGPAVNRAARVEGQADGGQFLICETTYLHTVSWPELVPPCWHILTRKGSQGATLLAPCPCDSSTCFPFLAPTAKWRRVVRWGTGPRRTTATTLG